jgi:hypothetical protein
MTYPSCHDLTNLNASCDAIKKVGGVTARVWIGKKRDFIDKTAQQYLLFSDPLAIFGYDVWVLYFDAVLASVTELAYFEGVQLKNTAGFEVVAGANVNAYNHNVNLVLFNYTQQDIAKLNTLMVDEDMVVFIGTESGSVKAYGFDYDDNNDLSSRLGMKVIQGTGLDPVELQGEVGVTLQLQAMNMTKAPLVLESVYEEDGANQLTDYQDIIDSLNLLAANNA